MASTYCENFLDGFEGTPSARQLSGPAGLDRAGYLGSLLPAAPNRKGSRVSDAKRLPQRDTATVAVMKNDP